MYTVFVVVVVFKTTKLRFAMQKEIMREATGKTLNLQYQIKPTQ